MISDIGGNLGLLLGASIFTVFELIEAALTRCWARRSKALVAAQINVKSAEVTGHAADEVMSYSSFRSYRMTSAVKE